ncbi:MAG: DUF2110 family protein, partial [Candidatus Heimdallarchaeaceae archaeon]
MIELTILEKTYNVAKHSAEKALRYILSRELEKLNVEIVDIAFGKDRYATITLSGEDEIIAKNILMTNYGTKKSIRDLKVGDKIYGRLKEVGKVKFGIFVDAGITTTTRAIEALYPLFALRKQLANGEKTSLVKIIRAYGFVDELPLFFEITKKQVIGTKVWLQLTSESVQWLKEPLQQNKEAIIVCGTTRRSIKTALIESRHAEDIDEIERIGLLEYRLICKKGTRAEGLIPELGPFLGRAKIGATIPKRI